MEFNPCKCFSLEIRALVVAIAVTVISTAKAILLLLSLHYGTIVYVVQPMERSYYNNHNNDTSFRLLNLELMNAEIERTEFALNAILVLELVLNIMNCINTMFLIIHGVKKERQWPLFNFLVFITVHFFLSLGIMNVKILLGTVSSEVVATEAVVLLVHLFFVIITFQVYRDLWQDSSEEESFVEANSGPREASALPSFENDEDATDTRAI